MPCHFQEGIISLKTLTYPSDSEVDGMFLPKGSTVVLNVWAMHHDNGTWKDPEHFIPERFESYPSLASTYAASGKWDERDHYGYGAGRRICPGKSDRERLPQSASLAFGELKH